VNEEDVGLDSCVEYMLCLEAEWDIWSRCGHAVSLGTSVGFGIYNCTPHSSEKHCALLIVCVVMSH
jgi:hypothetical protein